MPNPTQSDLHVNVPLTNVSVAYMQDKATVHRGQGVPAGCRSRSSPTCTGSTPSPTGAGPTPREAGTGYRDRLVLAGRSTRGSTSPRVWACPQGHRRPGACQRRLELEAGLRRDHLRHQPAAAAP